MKIKCNDGVLREFIPTETPNTKFVYQTRPAHCFHCGEEFNRKPSSEQKELWREHSCKTGTRKINGKEIIEK